MSLEKLPGTTLRQEFRLHATDCHGNPSTLIGAWFSLDDLPFLSMPTDDVGALQKHPRRGRQPVAPLHVTKGTKEAKGHRIDDEDHDDDGLFITAENDTPQMIQL